MQTPHTPVFLDSLDANELLMLGLRASSEGAGADALGYLKHAIAKQPDSSRAHWALAAEYASLRMPDRAKEHFARSLEIDPSPPVARFQYGLLMLTQGDVAQATAIWAPLDALAAEDSVRLFKDGLLLMAQDRFEEALDHINKAMTAPGVEPALKQDMKMVLARIEAAQRGDGAPAADAAKQAGQATASNQPSIESQLALSAYGGGDDSSRRH
jgi:tetratricopeptide (TPR) repeat protein